jgi:hypothetical protein
MTGADFYQGEDEMKEDETRISYPILCDMVSGVLTAAGVPVEIARLEAANLQLGVPLHAEIVSQLAAVGVLLGG